ncbi:MAG: family intrarane metalloprotease [Armatimonadetes bacterium]|jgi:membrane protease YdiL (CAAX protease family)|nr:family intrarane metalloprotease [Armatimonadota bacterium]
MNCLLHPQIPSSGTCEYCAQPHCAGCLHPLLGRMYCPGCYARVAGIANGRPAPPVGTPGAAGLTPDVAGAAPSARRPRLPGWLSLILYLIGFLVVEMGSQQALAFALLLAGALQGRPSPGGAGSLMDASGPGLPVWSALFAFFGYASVLLVLAYTALTARWLERSKLSDLGLRWRPGIWKDAASGLGLAAVLFISVVGTGISLGWYRLDSLVPGPSGLLTAAVGLVILLPFAAVEEISFRGYVMHAGRRSWGAWGGVIGSSVLFAAFHGVNPHMEKYPLAIVGLLLAGFYLATVVLITGDLWLAIFLHAGWNLMEGPVFGLPVSGMDVPASIVRTTAPGADLFTGGSFGPEAGMVLCVLMLIHLGVLWSIRPLLPARLAAPLNDFESTLPAEPETYQALRIG